MKKLITILFILLSVFGYSQRALQGDTLRVRYGGSFGGNVVLDTNQLKQLTYATDSLDAVPLGQMQDSISASSTALDAVSARNISKVLFIDGGGDTIKESFSHVHTEYALYSQLADYAPIDSALWRLTNDSIHTKTAYDIGMQEKNIYNADSIHANWYGGSDIVIGESGSKATINMDSVTLTNEVGIQDGSNALITSNEIYDYIQSYVNQTKFVQTEITEVTNTVTETTLIGTGVGSVTFGANTLDSGNVIRCKVYGVYTNAELSGDEDVTVRIKLNTTTFVAGTLTLENSTTDYDFTLDFDIVVQSDGSSGKFIIGGGAQVDQRASTFANYIGFTSTTTETINTTIAQTLDITAQWGTASTDYSISTITLTTELIKQ